MTISMRPVRGSKTVALSVYTEHALFTVFKSPTLGVFASLTTFKDGLIEVDKYANLDFKSLNDAFAVMNAIVK